MNSSVRCLHLSLLAVLLAVTALPLTAEADTACSARIGGATINEAYRRGNAARFVEIRILNPSISASDYTDWTLTICAPGGCLTRGLDHSAMDDSDYPWIILPRDGIPDADILNFGPGTGNQMEIRLDDADGRAIDYFSLGGYSGPLTSECAFVYDTTMEETNSNLVARVPDGTGDWTSAGPGESGGDPTPGGSNDDEPPTFPGYDHIRLTHPGTGLSCAASDITVQACADPDCSALYPDEVTVEFTSPDGNWGANPVTFQGSTTVPLQFTGATDDSVTITLDAAAVAPAAFNATRCFGGGTETCQMQIFPAGLALDTPDQTAGRPSDPITVAAVRRDDETQACVPAFSDVTREVQFWFDYLDPGPDDRPASLPVEVDGTEIGTSETGATVLPLSFDGNGVATIELRYADAGLMELNTLYLGSEATEDEGLVMPGSDSFVSLPAGFCIEPEQTCATADADCGNTLTAGADFDLGITAVVWQSDGDADFCSGNAPTPNFTLNDIALTHELVAPSEGEPGALALERYDHPRNPDASGSVDLQQRISEVGVFRIAIDPDASPNYHGATLPAAQSPFTGRFIPADFNVLVLEDGSLAPSCAEQNAYAYMGEPLAWEQRPELQITALSAQGSTTRNYTEGGFNKLTAADLPWIAATADAGAENALEEPFPVEMVLDIGSLTVTSPGVQRYRFAVSDSTTFVKTVDSLVAPFQPELLVELPELIDGDGVEASALPLDLEPETAFPVRYGRLRLQNAHGSELLPLILPLRAEYYDGTGFLLHADDSCWDYDTATVTLDPELTAVIPVSSTLDGGLPPAGEELQLEAPGAGTVGETRVTLPGPRWLQHDDTGDGELDDPGAVATFGIYEAERRHIHRRERF